MASKESSLKAIPTLNHSQAIFPKPILIIVSLSKFMLNFTDDEVNYETNRGIESSRDLRIRKILEQTE
jgi:hypothetical protein